MSGKKGRSGRRASRIKSGMWVQAVLPGPRGPRWQTRYVIDRVPGTNGAQWVVSLDQISTFREVLNRGYMVPCPDPQTTFFDSLGLPF